MKTLATIARILRLYAIALWVGGLVFFIVVAAIAFGNLPSTHEAGIVVRVSLFAIHEIGLYAGCVYVICATTLMIVFSERDRVLVVGLVLIAIMMALTCYSQLHIIPQMEGDRHQLTASYGYDMNAAPKSDPRHTDFDRLHQESTHVESAILLLGFIVLALAALQPTSDPHPTA